MQLLFLSAHLTSKISSLYFLFDVIFQIILSPSNIVNRVLLLFKDLPTKIQVVAMDSRSQLENKKIAIERLKLKILEINAKKSSAQKQNQWMNHLQLERGNPKKIFKM